jgi:hypothetical protein
MNGPEGQNLKTSWVDFQKQVTVQKMVGELTLSLVALTTIAAKYPHVDSTEQTKLWNEWTKVVSGLPNIFKTLNDNTGGAFNLNIPAGTNVGNITATSNVTAQTLYKDLKALTPSVLAQGINIPSISSISSYLVKELQTDYANPNNSKNAFRKSLTNLTSAYNACLKQVKRSKDVLDKINPQAQAFEWGTFGSAFGPTSAGTDIANAFLAGINSMGKNIFYATQLMSLISGAGKVTNSSGVSTGTLSLSACVDNISTELTHWAMNPQQTLTVSQIKKFTENLANIVLIGKELNAIGNLMNKSNNPFIRSIAPAILSLSSEIFSYTIPGTPAQGSLAGMTLPELLKTIGSFAYLAYLAKHNQNPSSGLPNSINLSNLKPPSAQTIQEINTSITGFLSNCQGTSNQLLNLTGQGWGKYQSATQALAQLLATLFQMNRGIMNNIG